MKISLSAIALIIGVSFSSCKKHEELKTSYQTVDVTLDMNKSYQYSFGSGKSHLTVTKQSQAYLVSELEYHADAATFNYTPKEGFIGSDVVEITLGEGHGERGEMEDEHTNSHGNCQNTHGGQKGNHTHNCSGHHDCSRHDKTVYTFRFTVKSTTPATITKMSSLSTTANQQ